jgi:putative tricarboxylic transport membrane protein
MLNNDQMSSIIWFIVGGLIILFSIPYGFGGFHSPGTGFLPFLVGLVICALAVIVFIQGTLARSRGKKWVSVVKGVKWEKPLYTLIALLFYVLLLDFLGFILASALLVAFLLRMIHPQRWLVVISGAMLTSILSYVIFRVWLKTQLPIGIFNF